MRALLLAGTLALASCAMSVQAEPDTEPHLTHNVFFELKDKDETAVQSLVDACYEYLAPHDGIVYFSAGPRHTDYQREVNDLNFDVALTIVFEDTAAQDAYQVTEPHLQFIEEFNENWASVRVFDSLAPSGSD
ncbi:MAG: Dabb family protein [Hyphomonas sp.]|nr:Dabb family protein [Hyphomonas sp.]